MTFLNVIYSSKLWLTVFLAVIMGMGTITPDIHPAEAAEVVCQETGDNLNTESDEQPNQPSKKPHDHHAHSCGSCHFHATPVQLRLQACSLPAQQQPSSSLSEHRVEEELIDRCEGRSRSFQITSQNLTSKL